MGTAYSAWSCLNLQVVGDWIGAYLMQLCPERSSGLLDVPREFRYAGLAHTTGEASPIRAAIRLLSAIAEPSFLVRQCAADVYECVTGVMPGDPPGFASHGHLIRLLVTTWRHRIHQATAPRASRRGQGLRG